MNLGEMINKKINLDLKEESHLELIKSIYAKCWVNVEIYNKMYEYYKGNTDSMKNYTFLTERSNLKINANYLKKFVKEEVSYTIGNPITYESRKENVNFINDIEYFTAHWNELHDTDLMKYLLIFSKVYEVYYVSNNEFCSKIIHPTDAYLYVDDHGDSLFFIHKFKHQFNDIEYIDVYTSDYIYHFNSNFEEVKKPTLNLFGEIPVSVGVLSYEDYFDSVYNDVKGLQDAFETNLSDIGNEISDFRNSYLKFTGCKVDEGLLPKMKKLGVLQVNNPNSSIDWLIKDINDTFIQNTLDRYEDTMYQLCCHINHNEKMQSNLSGIALRSRLIALENKCELNEKAHKNIIKNRIRFLCRYLYITKNKNYDYKDIKILYTPNIPMDDLSTAQMLSQAPEGVISKDTARGLFSFINNKSSEKNKVDKEVKSELEEVDLDEIQ